MTEEQCSNNEFVKVMCMIEHILINSDLVSSKLKFIFPLSLETFNFIENLCASIELWSDLSLCLLNLVIYKLMKALNKRE